MQEILYRFQNGIDGMEAELRVQENRDSRVELLSGKPAANVHSSRAGVSARVCRGGSFGFASCGELRESAMEACLKTALDNAEFLHTHAPRGLPRRKRLPACSVKQTVRTASAQAEPMEFLRALDAEIRRYPNLIGRRLELRADSSESYVLSGDGGSASLYLPRIYLYLTLTAETSAGEPVELCRVFGGCGSFGDRFRDSAAILPAAELLHEQLMQKREGVYPRAGKAVCVLGGGLSGMLAHEAVGHTVEADLVQSGSIGGAYLGKQAASPLVSITDFAVSAFGKPAPLPIPADHEGTRGEDAPLIRDGVLVGYMNDRASAPRYGMEPLGNARAYCFADEPLIRMRNTAIHPGNSRLEDLISSVDEGYYLTDTNNGQADTNGEFMFGVTMGYEIRGGKLGRAILDTTISGMAFDMLRTVDMVSDEMIWDSSGYCGKKQPIPVSVGGPALRCTVNVGGR